MSVILPEEQAILDPGLVARVMDKWRNRTVRVEFSSMNVYKKKDKILIALNVFSKEILDIRCDLGLVRKPQKFQTHITLLEKVV